MTNLIELDVVGMTCDHCARAVSTEVSALPGVSDVHVDVPAGQVRISADRTLSEIWHFRLKGAPEAIYRRSLWYFNLVNSPATMVNADDLENWTRGQNGLKSTGSDWVSFHRNMGGDTEKDGVLYSSNGTSEVVMRNQFRAWREYLSAA